MSQENKECKDVSVGVLCKLFGVASRTVSKWVDDGVLANCYRLPALSTGKKPGPRRIPAQSVIDLMYTMQMPRIRILAAHEMLGVPVPEEKTQVIS